MSSQTSLRDEAEARTLCHSWTTEQETISDSRRWGLGEPTSLQSTSAHGTCGPTGMSPEQGHYIDQKAETLL